MNIKELAEQAGFIVDKDSQKYQKQCIQSTHSLVDEPLAAFALLVAAHEREECIQNVLQQHEGFGTEHQGVGYVKQRIVEAIRARSKHETR